VAAAHGGGGGGRRRRRRNESEKCGRLYRESIALAIANGGISIWRQSAGVSSVALFAKWRIGGQAWRRRRNGEMTAHHEAINISLAAAASAASSSNQLKAGSAAKYLA